MTVRELIELLERENPENVVLSDIDDVYSAQVNYLHKSEYTNNVILSNIKR
jgi:hypothetical protein